MWNTILTDPFRGLERLDEELRGRGFAGGPSAPRFPAIRLYANERGVLLRAPLAGVQAEDLELSVEGDELVLSGTKADAEAPEGTRWTRRERATGRFARRIVLPFPVQAEGIEAVLDGGILEVRLPRSEQDLPRRIEVRGKSRGEETHR